MFAERIRKQNKMTFGLSLEKDPGSKTKVLLSGIQYPKSVQSTCRMESDTVGHTAFNRSFRGMSALYVTRLNPGSKTNEHVAVQKRSIFYVWFTFKIQLHTKPGRLGDTTYKVNLFVLFRLIPTVFTEYRWILIHGR